MGEAVAKRSLSPMRFTADGLLSGAMPNVRVPEKRKIDQLMSIVAETEQIAYRQKSCLKSRAQFSDGLARRFFVGRRKICAPKSARYHGLEQSSGSEGEYCGVE